MAPTTLQTLSSLLLHSSNRTDLLLTRLARLTSTTSGLDALLRTTYYTLLLLHSQLTRILSNRYEKLAVSIATKASETMLPGETLVATIEPPALKLTEWCASVKATGDVVEDVRIFIRMFGLLRIYSEAKELYAKGTRDPAIKLLTWSRITATAFYQLFENGAYIIRRRLVIGQKWETREKKLWLWSSRCWFAVVAIEMLRLMRVRQLRFNEEWGAESKDVTTQSKELEEKWWRSLYANLGWVPYALHFSYGDEEQSPISEAWIGAGALVPSVWALRDEWRAVK